MKKKVLITGGFGFVGSKLVELLEGNNNYDVVLLDNLISGNALDDKYMHGDVRNTTLMSAIVSRFDIIVHLAAIVGEPACIIDKSFAYDVNVKGTRNIITNMTKEQLLIFTSTSSVYGNRPNERVTEESLPIPVNNYARHKYISEQEIEILNIQHVILRPVTAFGITKRTRLDLLVNTLIYEALTKGEIAVFEPTVMRPIIHVIDYARIILAAMNGSLGINQIYNIGDNAYTMNKLQLAQRIADLCNARIIHKDEESLDPRNYDVSFDKLVHTGFRFGENRLELAVQEIRGALDTILAKPELFSTTYKVQQYIKESQ